MEIIGRHDDHHEQEADRVADTVTPAVEPAAHDDAGLLRGFGAELGHDFSRVRLHDDAAAHAMTARLGAEAVTIGHHVLFARGRHDPGSPAGRRLLAHELTHVRQQATTGPRVQGKFVATGDTAGFVALVNSILGVQKRIQVSAAGEVSIHDTNVQGPPTRDATELLAQIQSMVSERATITIAFTHGGTGVIVGSFVLSEVDLDDLARYGAESSHSRLGDNTASMLHHELVEQHRKQISGESFGPAHTASLAAQGRLLGATWVGDSPPATVPGGVEITRTWRYPDGREVDVITTIDPATTTVTAVRRVVRNPPAPTPARTP
ncbi:DUF4157 domain-containing protein [Myceligenerans crystallogenes]|uniref:eCIS core domain-containing protein n=1 Tax=Myceligenerans crystallogenes TaxID=316335 RepID=A0ABP4ZLQ3_9MICO